MLPPNTRGLTNVTTKLQRDRRFHSTDAAVAIVHIDIVRATNAGQITALVLLDLSAAFDTVDHGIPLDVLSFKFGVTDRVFEWFQSTRQPELKSSVPALTSMTLRRLLVVYLRYQLPVRCCSSLMRRI